ncbi:MAG: alpha/beta fold hydrolase [Armatimonadota bacterium]
MRTLFALGLIACLFTPGASQLTRADLAIKLIEMETCWEAHRHSLPARQRATRPLSEALVAFFAGRFSSLAQNLTLACLMLESETPPTPEKLYAGSIGVRLPRVVDKEALDRGELTPQIELFAYYEATKPDTPLQLRWKVIDSGMKRTISEGTLENPGAGATATLLARVPEGDYEVHFEIRLDKQVVRQWRQPVSVIANLAARLAALDQATKASNDFDPLEQATVQNALEVLHNAQQGVHPETFYPLLRLLRFAEQVVARRKEGKPGWQPAPGDYWMAIPYRERRVVFRLFVPPQFAANRPIPLVVALHGAGGNEHLFFDGYGLGIVLKEAEKRGWAVIAPRAEMGLAHIGGALEAAQKLLPIDSERIYLMGHSMGGAHSFAAIAQFPDKFRAVAIFAGAGQPTQVPTDLPILLTVGEQELAMLKNNVENAYRRLQAMNLKVLEYKKYEGCDHLMIVREAMGDAFAFFDRAPARQKPAAIPSEG